MLKIYSKYEYLIDIFFCVCIVILSLIKGGFYPEDTIWFNLVSFGIYFFLFSKIYLSNPVKLNEVDILVVLLPITYVLPIVFKIYSNYTDSFTEMLRYLNFAVIYFVVKSSNNKKYFVNTLITVGVIQAFVGVDSISAKLLQPLLNLFDSGYLSIAKYADRMSGTIQYANTFAIIVAISAVLVLDKLSINFGKKGNNISYTALFLLNSTIMLSNSRIALSIYIISVIFYLVYLYLKKSNDFRIKTVSLITQIPTLLIYTSIISGFVNINEPYYIYAIFFVGILVNFLISNTVYSLLVSNKFNNMGIFKNPKRILFAITAFLVIYLIAGINLEKKLIVTAGETQKSISRSIYNIEYGKINKIDLSVEKIDGTDYSIEVYDQNEGSIVAINSINGGEYPSGKIYFEFVPLSKNSNLKLVINCSVGSIKIDRLLVNEKNIKLDYYLLPSNLMFRMSSGLRIDDSFSSRIIYAKDAMKLISKSPLFGLGGEGFSNTYKEVQTEKYISSEVHNSFLQIFVESGILGGAVCISIIVISFVKSRFNSIKLALIIFVAHSFTDLNFSYMISICIFAILLALIEEKDGVDRIKK